MKSLTEESVPNAKEPSSKLSTNASAARSGSGESQKSSAAIRRKRSCANWMHRLLDRRTIVSLLSIAALFTLAFRGIEPKAAIEALAFITIGLIAGNASQQAATAWAQRGSVKPKG